MDFDDTMAELPNSKQAAVRQYVGGFELRGSSGDDVPVELLGSPVTVSVAPGLLLAGLVLFLILRRKG